MRTRQSVTGLAVLGAMAVLGLCIVPSSVGAATATSSWTQPGYNGARNQANLTEKTLTSGNVQSVALRRAYTGLANTSKNECAWAGTAATNPVVSGGYLYTSIDESVARTSLKTGVTSWRRDPLPPYEGQVDGINIELAVAGGLVFVTMLDCESQSDPFGQVYALNANTGATQWVQSSDPAEVDISVSGNYVVLSGGGFNSGYAVDVYKLATGVNVWEHFLDYPCDETGRGSIIEGGQVISCTSFEDGGPNTIEANALASGALTWRLKAESITPIRGDTDAVATGHQLYLDTPNGIVDVNPKNGTTKFTMAGATSIGSVSSTTVYGTCGKNLCAFDTASGSPTWSVRNPTSGTPSAWADGVLYLSDGSSVNDSNGAVLTQDRIAGPVVVGAGYVVVGTGSSRTVDIYGLPNS